MSLNKATIERFLEKAGASENEINNAVARFTATPERERGKMWDEIRSRFAHRLPGSHKMVTEAVGKVKAVSTPVPVVKPVQAPPVKPKILQKAPAPKPQPKPELKPTEDKPAN